MTNKKKKKRTRLNGTKKTKRTKSKLLSAVTVESARDYLKLMNGHKPDNLLNLFIGQVEKPLLETVLEYTGGNQSQAAEVLGISRGTLRKKLVEYSLISS